MFARLAWKSPALEQLDTSNHSATPGDQTTSAGVSTWNGRESAEALFARTDAALYQAKESGRDQTVISGNVHT